MRRIRVLLLLLVPAVVIAQEKQEAATKLSKEEEAILVLTNQEREKEKLPPLRINPKLLQAARDHSANMAKQNKMDHVLDGKKPTDRLRDVGYDYLFTAENVAYGQRTAADVLQVWMNSPGHRANILRKPTREIGVGVARSSRGIPYYTQVFGTPQPR